MHYLHGYYAALMAKKNRDEDLNFFSSDPGQLKKMNKLEFVDSDLYILFKMKNNFPYPLLKLGSGFVEKSNGSGRPSIRNKKELNLIGAQISMRNHAAQ